jgi:CheY-like chemotaxis protein
VVESYPSKVHPSKKKVFVVDDDDAIVSLFKTALELEGFNVRTGRDGRNFLARALEYQPDLIIADLMMPAGGGYELIRTLQSDPLTSSIPIVLVTGSHLDASTQAMMKMESNLAFYLEKPVRPESLMLKVHSLLKTLSLDEQRKVATKDFPVDFKDVF